MKKQENNGAQYYACRYWKNSREWEVALYFLDPEEHPHDWQMVFTPQEWRKIGGAAPKKNETWIIYLKAERKIVDKLNKKRKSMNTDDLEHDDCFYLKDGKQAFMWFNRECPGDGWYGCEECAKFKGKLP